MLFYKNLSFTQKILVSMLAGAIIGIILNNIEAYHSIINEYLLCYDKPLYYLI